MACAVCVSGGGCIWTSSHVDFCLCCFIVFSGKKHVPWAESLWKFYKKINLKVLVTVFITQNALNSVMTNTSVSTTDDTKDRRLNKVNRIISWNCLHQFQQIQISADLAGNSPSLDPTTIYQKTSYRLYSPSDIPQNRKVEGKEGWAQVFIYLVIDLVQK